MGIKPQNQVVKIILQLLADIIHFPAIAFTHAP
jgi:hypothetical protein